MEELLPEQNWWQRNWKWAAPTGGCLVVVVLLIVFLVKLIMGVSTMFSDSEPYQMAVKKAQESSWVTERLGEPVEPYGNAEGNLNWTNGVSTADMRIRVKGPKEEATLMVWAKKPRDEWTYTLIKIKIDETGEQYDLINNRELLAEEN